MIVVYEKYSWDSANAVHHRISAAKPMLVLLYLRMPVENKSGMKYQAVIMVCELGSNLFFQCNSSSYQEKLSFIR